jgi:transposase-like protein
VAQSGRPAAADDPQARRVHGRGRNRRPRLHNLPKEHWTKIHSVNPLERLNGEVKRRSDVVGIFPNDDAVVRLVGALMLEQNDEWAVGRRYMSLESLASLSDDPIPRLSAVTA